MVQRRTNGFNPVGQLREEVDRLFGDFFGQAPVALRRGAVGARAFPAVNVWERGDDLYAEVEVPGLGADDVDISVVGTELVIKGRQMDLDEQGVSYHRREPEDLNISVTGNTLVLSGEKKETTEKKGKDYRQTERRFGSFRRSVTLPQGVDADKVSADYAQGVLTIRLARSPEAAPKRIPVNAS